MATTAPEIAGYAYRLAHYLAHLRAQAVDAITSDVLSDPGLTERCSEKLPEAVARSLSQVRHHARALSSAVPAMSASINDLLSAVEGVEEWVERACADCHATDLGDESIAGEAGFVGPEAWEPLCTAADRLGGTLPEGLTAVFSLGRLLAAHAWLAVPDRTLGLPEFEGYEAADRYVIEHLAEATKPLLSEIKRRYPGIGVAARQRACQRAADAFKGQDGLDFAVENGVERVRSGPDPRWSGTGLLTWRWRSSQLGSRAISTIS